VRYRIPIMIITLSSTCCLSFIIISFAGNRSDGLGPGASGNAEVVTVKGTSADLTGASRLRHIHELIALAKNDQIAATNRALVVGAIRKLGELRAVEAAPAIAERLDFHMNKSGVALRRESLPPRAYYPAIKALIDIGGAALPVIADALAAKSRSPLYNRNAMATLTGITGHRSRAQKYVRQRIELYKAGVKRLGVLVGN